MSEMARKQLDKRFRTIRSLNDFARPPKGWVRAVRDALGMTTAQLGERLQVSQSRASGIERAEADESITLATLRRAAEALDCTLVYALVPRQSLEESVMQRARERADMKLARIDHTMRLENQAVDHEELNSAREQLARSLAENPRRLWDKP